MKLILEPTRSRHMVTYSAEGDIVTATVNGVEEPFDFTGTADGDYLIEPSDDALEVSSVTRAIRQDGVLTVYATHHFGPPPTRQMMGDGEEAQLEPEADYTERLAAYEQEKQTREIEL